MIDSNFRAVLNLINNYLNNFANSIDFSNGFDLAFGDNYDQNLVGIFQRQWQSNTFTIPPIEVVQEQVLGTAVGAFDATNNTIYISDTLVNSGDIDRLAAVLLEQLGGWIDTQINTQDSARDRGEIFSNLVQGNQIGATQSAGLKAEDDRAMINLNDSSIAVEQANPTVDNDTLDGTSGDDSIDALAGNDIINGLAGNDNLIGGDGNDTINGGEGEDIISGDAGNDIIDAGGGADHVYAGSGNDLLIVDFSSSTTLNSFMYDDEANSHAGVYSSDSQYLAFNGIERFDIIGSSGNDNLVGGKNNDTLQGGAGNDFLGGGGGMDIFTYSGLLLGATTTTDLFGVDSIVDFTSNQDKISLSKAIFSAITSAAGTAMDDNFITVNDDSLVDTQSAAIVYSLGSGGLFYNQNGATAGLGTNGGEFANIFGSASLVASDFTLI